MNSTIYNSELNDFSRKFLVKSPAVPAPSPYEFIAQRRVIDASLFESFLLFDTLSFKVHGENIPLVILLNHFGVKGVEALLDQNALKFILWDQMLGHMVDDIDGIDPLTHGHYNSPAHSDPEESIRLGFNWMSKPPRTSDKKNLIRKIIDVYSMPEKNLSSKAVALSKSAYDSGKLEVYGLSPEKSTYRELDLDGRKMLCECAEEILQYTHLIDSNMSSYSNFEFYQIFNDSNRKIHEAANLQENFNELSKLENIPDLNQMFPDDSKPFDKVLKLRNKSSSKKFRSWLAECTNSEDSLEITKEYVDAIANSKGFFQTKMGRFTKNVAMSAVGVGVGLLVAGPAGAVGGAGAAKLLEPAADFGLDMLDEFVLSGLTKGWTPKIFFDDLTKLEKFNESKHSGAENCAGV
ncbi:hypothetical protein [Salinivibrio sp. SS2]|uniref:hypothetical protein n=1 Tax=Salinivibrio sp. SS2 TaxID=1892894 RepID=UPI00084BDD0B|nr:hypothetical protein [Salinivibrio sp. DV]ODQ00294.1 hypothetical protein BGK46_07810 [Salinivibrio sp. DV]